jgi:hypothetical protein
MFHHKKKKKKKKEIVLLLCLEEEEGFYLVMMAVIDGRFLFYTGMEMNDIDFCVGGERGRSMEVDDVIVVGN